VARLHEKSDDRLYRWDDTRLAARVHPASITDATCKRGETDETASAKI
jgi:hypothetical protein